MHLNELTHVTFAITKKCNLSCIWCYENASRNSKEVILSDIKSVIDQLAKLPRLKRLVFTGGEPFMHSNIREILDYCFEKNISHVHITTNATLDIEKILKYYVGKNLSLSVSVDGMEDVHDAIRGKGTFNKTISNIQKATALGFAVSVTTTVSKNNIEAAAALADFLKERGIVNLKFQRMRSLGKGATQHDLVLTQKDNEALTERILNIKKEIAGKIGVGYKDPFLNTIDLEYLDKYKDALDSCICGGCRCGMSYLFITVDGDVHPCPFLEVKLGNAFSENIGDIWLNSELLQAFRVRENYNKCKDCKFWSVCRGCRAEAFIHTKNIFGDDPGCWRN